MNINPLLNRILKEATKLPVAQDEYDGKEDKYIIFTYIDERPTFYADNKPAADEVHIQIQLITPKKFNYLAMKDTIRDALEDNDFSVYSITSFLGDVFQGTEKIRQTIFEARYASER